jgi:hypothetical protein
MDTLTSDEAIALADQIGPMLRGRGVEVQGGALADLVARWLSGMLIVGDADMTDTVREVSLKVFCSTVRKLIPVNEPDLVKAFKRTLPDDNNN